MNRERLRLAWLAVEEHLPQQCGHGEQHGQLQQLHHDKPQHREAGQDHHPGQVDRETPRARHRPQRRQVRLQRRRQQAMARCNTSRDARGPRCPRYRGNSTAAPRCPPSGVNSTPLVGRAAGRSLQRLSRATVSIPIVADPEVTAYSSDGTHAPLALAAGKLSPTKEEVSALYV